MIQSDYHYHGFTLLFSSFLLLYLLIQIECGVFAAGTYLTSRFPSMFGCEKAIALAHPSSSSLSSPTSRAPVPSRRAFSSGGARGLPVGCVHDGHEDEDDFDQDYRTHLSSYSLASSSSDEDNETDHEDDDDDAGLQSTEEEEAGEELGGRRRRCCRDEEGDSWWWWQRAVLPWEQDAQEALETESG